ncbi:hypothetical protein Gohar_011565, partial [Gossypium harknessii]|nr:hypothetical protein [Gossypium harknessii]
TGLVEIADYYRRFFSLHCYLGPRFAAIDVIFSLTAVEVFSGCHFLKTLVLMSSGCCLDAFAPAYGAIESRQAQAIRSLNPWTTILLLEFRFRIGFSGFLYDYHLFRLLILIIMEAKFFRFLKIVGVGYKARAEAEGRLLFLKLGYSHEVELPVPPAVRVFCFKNNVVCCTGLDKQRVHQFAATVRSCKPPEVYKGKGIMYIDEVIKKKQGKKSK